VGSLLLPCIGSPPRYYNGVRADQLAWHQNGTVHVYTDILSMAECEAVAAVTWEQRELWTHVSAAGPLPHFSFGWTANFDRDHGAVPMWSWHHGLRQLAGAGSFHALSLEAASLHRRNVIQAALVARINGILEPLRGAIAAHLGVERSAVVLGGERGAEALGHPGVQVYLPNIHWHAIVNYHLDSGAYAGAYGLQEQTQCDGASSTAFLLPIIAPPGTGLLHYNASGEHETLYERGSMVSFDAKLLHSIRPWPVPMSVRWPWRPMSPLSDVRMTVQAFATRCGDTWLVYH